MGTPDHGPLIGADELRAALHGAAPPTVLDVRWRLGGPAGPEEYAAAHVPGAAYVDLETALAAPPGDGGRGRHPLPEPAVFVAAMRAAGVRREHPVVVYDDWSGRAAARCWWLLGHYGHPDVRVLDGGWAAWLAAGGPQESRRTTPPPGDFDGRPGRLSTVAARDLLEEPATLVDARAPARFRGEQEPVDPVAGHVPGAVNVPTESNLTDAGTFRPAAELAAAYPEGRVVAYCGSGVTACHDLLALAVAGREGALFPGSWSEWVSDPARPVETGAGAG